MQEDKNFTRSSGAREGLRTERWGTAGEEMLEKVRVCHETLKQELSKVIVGQNDVVEMVLAAILCKGHALLEGVPGLGKTLLVRTLARLLKLDFKRVQFTPDLMPSDIIGTEIIQQDPVTQLRDLKFLPGPIFTHLLLADEINRTSPKTQSALLQAMQDHEVSVGNKTYKLEEPFFVLATQNPIDQEGVYPLPEAQLDRFMFNIYLDYPDREEEFEIVKRYSRTDIPDVAAVLDREEILELQYMAQGMLISDSLVRYAVDLITATRPSKNNPNAFVNDWVEWGAGPRASLYLVMAAKSLALLRGRPCVALEDIRTAAPAILRHRIKINFSGEAEGVRSLELLRRLVEKMPGPKDT